MLKNIFFQNKNSPVFYTNIGDFSTIYHCYNDTYIDLFQFLFS